MHTYYNKSVTWPLHIFPLLYIYACTHSFKVNVMRVKSQIEFFKLAFKFLFFSRRWLNVFYPFYANIVNVKAWSPAEIDIIKAMECLHNPS